MTLLGPKCYEYKMGKFPLIGFKMSLNLICGALKFLVISKRLSVLKLGCSIHVNFVNKFNSIEDLGPGYPLYSEDINLLNLAKGILGRILPCCCFTMKILRITNNIAAVNFSYYTLHCQHNISWRLQNLEKDYWDLDFFKISNKVSLFEEKKVYLGRDLAHQGGPSGSGSEKAKHPLVHVVIGKIVKNNPPPHTPHFWSMCFIKFLDS